MKKLLSLVLTLCLLLSTLPLNLSLAENEDDNGDQVVSLTEEVGEEAAGKTEKSEDPAPAVDSAKEQEAKNETPESKKETASEEEKVTEPAQKEQKKEAESPKQEEKAAEAVKTEEKAETPAEEVKDEEAVKPETSEESAEKANSENTVEKEPAAEETPAEAELPAEEQKAEAQDESAAEEPKEAVQGGKSEPQAAEELEPELDDEELIGKVQVEPPSGLEVVDGSGTYNSVKLQWTASPTAGATYEIDQTDGTGFTKIASDVNATTYTVKNLTCGTTYTFRVRAMVGSSYSLTYTDTVDYTPKPAAPVIESVTQKPSTTITLKWKKVAGASGYRIYRRTNGGTKEQIKEINASDTLTYADKGLIMGPPVDYFITAFATVGSNKVEGEEAKYSISQLKPLAVQNIKVESAGINSAKITWDALPGAASYKVYRANTSGGSLSQRSSEPVTELTFTDDKLQLGSTYYYHVTAVIDNTEGVYGAADPYTHDMKPMESLTVTAQDSSTISLGWDRDEDVERYLLEYKLASDPDTKFVEVGSPADQAVNPANDKAIEDNIDNWIVKGLKPSTLYHFRIAPVVGGNPGPYSDKVLGYTIPCPATDLEVDSFDYNIVTLKWEEDSSFTTGKVEIYRTTSDGKTKKLGSVARGVKTYSDKTVITGEEYTYYVRTLVSITSPKAIDLRGDESNKVEVKPRNQKPATVTASARNSSSITVKWSQVTGASGYRVQMRVVGAEEWSTAVTVEGGATLSAIVNNLTAGTLYEFRVSAYREVATKNVFGVNSDKVEQRVLPGKPGNLKVAVASATSLTLSWDAVGGAVGYYVWMQAEDAVGAGTFTNPEEQIASVKETTYTVEGLKTGLKYNFSVQAYVTDSDGLEWPGKFADPVTDKKPIPTAPTDFKATSASSMSVKLTWKAADLGGIAGSGYEIRYSTDGVNYTLIKTITDETITSWTHNYDSSMLACEKHWYRLRSIVPSDGQNIGSKYLTVEITPEPTKGKDLALSSSKTTEMVLKFGGEPASTGVVYYIERKAGSDAWSKIGKTTAADYDTTDKIWVYKDTTVKAGIKYSYRVRGCVTSGSDTYYSAYSASVAGLTKPAKTTSVKGVSRNAITIRVNYNLVTGADGYQVQRSVQQDAGFVTLGTSAKKYYDDKTAVTGKTYFYRVRAYYTYDTNSVQYGGWAYLDAPQRTEGVKCVPMPPTEFAVSAKTYNSVTLKWKKTAGENCHYKITYENVTEGTSEVTATDGNDIEVTAETFKVKGLKVGNEYIFRIYTVAKLENGSYLTSDPAATALIPIVPEKVTGVKVSSEPPADGSNTKLYNKVSWSSVKGAVGYDVWRVNPDGSKTKVATELSEAPYYDTDSSFTVGDVYGYYVQAIGANSKKGTRSTEVKVTVLPNPVSGLKTESAGSTKIYLKWNNMGADKYQIYCSTKSGELGKLIKTTTSTSYTNGNLICGTTYYYTIKAVKVSGSTSYVAKGSTQVKGKPLPLAPKITSAAPKTALRALLKWKKSTYRNGTTDKDVSGYQMVYRIAGSGDKWASGGSVSKSSTSGKAKTKLTKKEYEFAVRAFTTVNGSRKYGPYSEILKTTLEPLIVNNLKAGGVNTSNIPLTWNQRTDVTGYNVYTSTDNVKFKKVGSTTETNFKLENITPGVLTYIKVTCYVAQNDTEVEFDVDSSTSISSYIKLSKPVLTLDSNADNGARVKWEKIKGASGYKIRAKIGKTGTWKVLDKINDSAMVAYLHDTNNTSMPYNPSKTIYYQVQAFAVQSDGNTVYSSWSDQLEKPKK